MGVLYAASVVGVLGKMEEETRKEEVGFHIICGTELEEELKKCQV